MLFGRVKAVVLAAQELAQQVYGPASDFFDLDERTDSLAMYDWRTTFEALDPMVAVLRRSEIAVLSVQHNGWDCMEQIRDAVKHVEESLPERGSLGSTSHTLVEAAEDLFIFSQELDEYLYRKAIAVFGVWGAHWFRFSAENLPVDLLLSESLPHNVPTPELFRLLNTTGEETNLDRAIEARSQWIYEQVMAGVKYPDIIAELRKKPVAWGLISTVPGIKGAACAYAKRHVLPMPERRRPGRPPGT